MDFSSNLDEYIQESIEHSLGLPVSATTLELKLLASDEARRRLQDQIFLLQDQSKEKDLKIDRSRAEASMNAQALRKCIEENQNLSAEREHLLHQCRRWEQECALFDSDREALMDFGDDAFERAKKAEARALEAEDDCKRLSEQINHYKRECETYLTNAAKATEESLLLRQRMDELEHARLQACNDDHLACSHCSSLKENDLESHLLPADPDDSSGSKIVEAHILEPVIASVLSEANSIRQLKDEVAGNACSFLEAHMGHNSCQSLWKSLKPLTKDIVALAAEVELLKKDKEHLRINLHRAEEEVKVLFEENKMLNMENEKLVRQYTRGKHNQGSKGKHSNSVSGKGKRKSSPRTTNSTAMVIDFCELDSPRQPLSPLQQNSPNARMHKK